MDCLSTERMKDAPSMSEIAQCTRFYCHFLAMIICNILLLNCVITYGNPSITNVIPSDTQVGQYKRFVITADITTSATNYYWPYDTNTPTSIPSGTGVSVDGLFSNDDWTTTVTVPGFYCQDYTQQFIGTSEAVIPSGTPHWVVRFAPTTTGTWKYKLRVQDSSGITYYPNSGDQGFECVVSTSHGFVGVSAKDSRYFETSDGTPVLGPGINADFRSAYDIDSQLKTYGDNGIKIARWWMDYRGWQNPFGGGDVATNGGPQWSFSLSMNTGGGAKSGDRYAAYLSPGKATYQNIYMQVGKLYRLTGSLKLSSVVGTGSTGIVASIGSSAITALTGTQDWTSFTVDFIPTSSGFYLAKVLNTGSSGTAYFDDLSVRFSSDGGSQWSGECLVKGDMDFENYIDQIEAARVDWIFESAEKHGVYLKTVISEKQDRTLGSINSDGSVGTRTDDNFYSSDNYPSRWLQKAWWRYLTARWGAYTSRHSWELCNEGDPFNSNHYNAANALATYVHSIDPNKALCTTSFWHSIPMDFWKISTCDYIDLHEYIGPTVSGTESHGPRFYAWYDPTNSTINAGSLIPIVDTGGSILFDDKNLYCGSRSCKIIAYDGANSLNTCCYWTSEYHVGINPSHTYTLRFRAKGINLSAYIDWTRPGVVLTWSKAYHENDWIGSLSPDSSRKNTPMAELGTYDWQTVTVTGIAPPALANTANIGIQVPRGASGAGDGLFYIDDIEFIDETTGKDLFVDGGFEGDRIDYDTALAVKKYGMLLNSYGDRINKPSVWAETGIRGLNAYGSPYKEYSYYGVSQELIDDNGGIDVRKAVWSHIGPDNPNMLYWFCDNITEYNLWYYFKAFQSFMSGIPVSNGNYKDILAATSVNTLRAWGQKDLTNNRAHLWVDNTPYTWKAVVDHNYSPESWGSSVTYAKDSTCGSGSPTHIYKSLQDNNKNNSVTDTTWWQDMGEFNASNNPALPSPVSGTVTIPGLKDGNYKAEWWNTSTGTITKTDDVQCTGGNITLSVQNLQSDVAVKIYPNPPRINLQVLVPSTQVIPGQTVTVTVEYTNSGDTDASNVTVSARVPAEMDYVAGSGEATGGTWNADTKTITWIVDSVSAHGTGSRTFQAKVR